jgi:hypothetical protein
VLAGSQAGDECGECECNATIIERRTQQKVSSRVFRDRSLHGDSDAFRVLAILRSAQYARMRAAMASRLFGVSRALLLPRSLVGAVFVDFAGGVGSFRLEDLPAVAAGDGVCGTGLAAGFGAGVAGAISMPNISDRSSLASTFGPAGRLPFVDNPEPADAISSC